MAATSSGRAALVLSGLAGGVLVAGVLLGMWLTAIAMSLMIIAQFGTYYGRRRARRR